MSPQLQVAVELQTRNETSGRALTAIIQLGDDQEFICLNPSLSLIRCRLSDYSF